MPNHSVMVRLSLFLLIAFFSPVFSLGQVTGYNRLDTFIQMRDGTKLYTEIYIPSAVETPLPILFTRTPYGVRVGNTSYGDYRLQGGYKELATEQYIFVFQDIRGKYKSQGAFTLLTPVDSLSKTNESTDAFDSIDWLVKHVKNNNGKVGMLGISYNSWLAAMGLINPHPALRTVSLQGTPSDLFIGDDFFHYGAFRMSPSFGYAVIMKENRGYNYKTNDVYNWFLNLGSLSAINSDSVLNGKNEYWNDFMRHLNYDAYWQQRCLTKFLKSTTLPTLHVAGTWDDQDLYGSLKTYQQLEKSDSNHLNYLVFGPWYHAGWEDPDDYYKKISLGGNTAKFFLEGVQAPWFRYHLKNEGKLDMVEASVFKTGKNSWEYYDKWPPTHKTKATKFYLNQGKRLHTIKPNFRGLYSSFNSDPSDPVPYMERPIPGFWEGGSLGWKADDQAFSGKRADVLTFSTEVLEQDIEIMGDIKVKLYAATSGSDCDWVIKLIDVYPDNYDSAKENSKYDMSNFQMLIADEVIRAKYRNSFERPERVEPNKVISYEIDLLQKSHCFKKGHRIMIHVQSSWFPLIDRNPQTFTDIGKAAATDYKKAIQKVYHSADFPSYIELPLKAH